MGIGAAIARSGSMDRLTVREFTNQCVSVTGREAQGIVREWEADGKSRAEISEPEAVTVEQAFRSFIEDLEAGTFEYPRFESTICLVVKCTNLLCAVPLGSLVKLTSSMLREFRAEWKDGPLSSSKKLERLRAFFRFAQESKWIDENPALKLKAPNILNVRHFRLRQPKSYEF